VCVMPSCKVCRQTIATVDEGVTFAAAGRPLFTVHKVPCASYVNATVTALSLLAVKGLHGVLLKKAPQLLKVLEQVQQLKG